MSIRPRAHCIVKHLPTSAVRQTTDITTVVENLAGDTPPNHGFSTIPYCGLRYPMTLAIGSAVQTSTQCHRKGSWIYPSNVEDPSSSPADWSKLTDVHQFRAFRTLAGSPLHGSSGKRLTLLEQV